MCWEKLVPAGADEDHYVWRCHSRQEVWCVCVEAAREALGSEYVSMAEEGLGCTCPWSLQLSFCSSNPLSSSLPALQLVRQVARASSWTTSPCSSVVLTYLRAAPSPAGKETVIVGRRAEGQNKLEANFCFPAFDFAIGIVFFWQSFQHVISLVWKGKT